MKKSHRFCFASVLCYFICSFFYHADNELFYVSPVAFAACVILGLIGIFIRDEEPAQPRRQGNRLAYVSYNLAAMCVFAYIVTMFTEWIPSAISNAILLFAIILVALGVTESIIRGRKKEENQRNDDQM